MIRITINDNDFLFLMSRISEYVCLVLPEYKNNESISSRYRNESELVVGIIKEFLDSTHVDDYIKCYIMDWLRVSIVSSKINANDDCVFYIDYSDLEGKFTYYIE